MSLYHLLLLIIIFHLIIPIISVSIINKDNYYDRYIVGDNENDAS
jgi:hypothetical protein